MTTIGCTLLAVALTGLLCLRVGHLSGTATRQANQSRRLNGLKLWGAN